jgi:Polysaccharide deacetylase
MSPVPVFLHSITGPPGTRLARSVDSRPLSNAPRRSLITPLAHPVAHVSGPGELIDEAARDLPNVAATSEAIAVRLRRAGVSVEWREPVVFSSARAYISFCHARGRSSLAIARADPSLVSELQLGSFFEYGVRGRIRRRLLSRFGVHRVLGRLPSARLLRVAGDLSFWAGVRSAATPIEWRRLTRSSYVVFGVHDIAGEGKPPTEPRTIPAKRLEEGLRLLRLLGWRPLGPDELIAFHESEGATLSRRRYVLAVDHFSRDALTALERWAETLPYVFVFTSLLDERVWGAEDEKTLTWGDARALAAIGGTIGSQGRHNKPLTRLNARAVELELSRSLIELQAHVDVAFPLLAYPFGAHSARIRDVARRVGYRGGFTTNPGRNGAGTDPLGLRRTEIIDSDGPVTFLWKAVTGGDVPWWWRPWRVGELRARRAAHRRRAREEAWAKRSRNRRRWISKGRGVRRR